MQIYLFKPCARTTRKQRITAKSLIEAVKRVEHGVIDADLGRGLFKQRLARPGEGKSGGFRLLLAYKAGVRAVFLLSFAKNDKDNLTDDQVEKLSALAGYFLALSDSQIRTALQRGQLIEVSAHE